MRDKTKFLIILILVSFPLLLQSFIYRNILIDDAFITYRYSENLVKGFGPVWNPGEDPVEGYTEFLWMVMNTFPIYMGIHPLMFSKCLGFAASLGIVLIPLTSINQFHCYRSGKILTSFLIAICPVIGFYGQSGMGHNFFTFFLFAAFFYYLLRIKYDQCKYLYISSSLFGISALSRPEGLFFFGITFIYEAYISNQRDGLRRSIITILRFTLCFMLIWLPYYAWRFHYYQYIFPNTFYAKHTGGGLNQIIMGAMYSSYAINNYLYLALAFSVLLLIPISIRCNNTLEKTDNNRTDSIKYIFYFMMFHLIYVVSVGGDDGSAFPSARLFIPLIPIGCVLIGKCLEVLYLHSSCSYAIGIIITSFLMFNSSIGDAYTFFKRSYPTVKSHHRLSEIVGVVSSINSGIYEEPPLAKWIRSQCGPEDSIAVPWAGVISYYSKVKVIDTLGLNDVHIAHLPKAQRGVDVKMDPEYVLSRKPLLIFINVAQEVATGKKTFEEGGGWKVGDKKMLEMLLASSDYELVTHAPTDVAVFKRID